MKINLTDNGILSLYNINNQAPVKLQVLFLAQWKMAWFLRLTDGKVLSPVVILLKMSERLSVGDVINIKRVQLQQLGSCREDLYPLADADLCHLLIIEYQVMEPKPPNQIHVKGLETTYWDSLCHVRQLLVKADSSAETFFKEEEERTLFLQGDCDLLRERGNELFKMKEFTKAILHYDMAKQKVHFEARVWNNSSQAFYKNEEYEEAKRDALVAIKLDPFNQKGYYRAGQAMQKCNDLNTAVEIVEAGLFVAGKWDDLQKMLRKIKESIISVLTSEPKIAELNKKNVNGGVNLSSEPPSTKKSRAKDSKKEKDHNSKTSKLSAALSNQKTQIGPILSFLEGARMLYETGKFQNALEIYRDISTKYNCDFLSKSELQVLKYLITICKIKGGKGNMEDNIISLTEMTREDFFPYSPALHYWLVRCYETLNFQENIILHANSCAVLLSKITSPIFLYWPGTKDLISETSPEELKLWYNEGSWRPAPLTRCRYEDCISAQGSSVARIDICTSDFDFRGYVEVLCEENCSICYHPCCWKTLKEEKEPGQPGKRVDKEFLGLACYTPDCCGKLSSIRIFDEFSQIKNEVIKDKKEKKNALITKPKKRKDKKKDKLPGANQHKLNEDKKKHKNAEVDMVNGNNLMEDDSSLTKSSEEKPTLPIEPVDFESNNYKILKQGEDQDFQVSAPKKIKSKNSKRKKNKVVSQLSFMDEVEGRMTHNTYLTRLRELKSYRDSQEVDVCVSGNASTNGLRFLPDLPFDPDRPFYLPRHLKDNNDVLERVLQSKMISVSSSDVNSETINTLLEFMYFWLKEHTPMAITDSRLSECMSESFPPNAIAYVNKCGGIKSFLLQSFKFAVIDDLICVNEQVLTAQDQVVSATLEKFKSSKYLFSDGHRAQRLSHLIDDSKSTSSTNSSMSTQMFPAANGHPESQINKPSTVVPNITSYKSAAMAKVVKKEPEAQANAIPQAKRLQQPTQAPKQLQETPRKRKLKTMDIDAIEVIGAGEVGQLFSPCKPPNFNHFGGSKEDFLPLSEDDQENSMSALQFMDACKLDSTIKKMMEKAKSLEEELVRNTSKMERLTEERDLLSSKNQEINDRFSQIKTKTAVEISALIKEVDDAAERANTAEANLEWVKTQRESEIRKMNVEKTRLQEEVKSQLSKIDGLQLRCDKLDSLKNQLEGELQQKSIQLTQQQEQVLSQQDSLSNTTERARDAEFKYLSVKRELIKNNLEKTKKRLMAETNKMRELLPDTSESSHPRKSVVLQSIAEWEDTINKIQNAAKAVAEDGQRFVDYISHGRPLTALPPGDLQVPTVPDLTVAHLLTVTRQANSQFRFSEKSHSPVNFVEKPNNKSNFPPPSLGYFGYSTSSPPPYNSPFNSSFNPPSLSKVSGLTSGVPFSPGQLPIGAGIPSASSERHFFNSMNGVGGPSPSKHRSNLMHDGMNKSSAESSPGSTVPSTGPEPPSFPPSRGSSDATELLVSQIPWSFNEDNLKPIVCGNHALNVQSKMAKMPPPKLSTPDALSSLSGTSTSISSVSVGLIGTPKQETPSAYGLQGLVEANWPTRTLPTPTDSTTTKPKFQSLRMQPAGNIGAIGTGPPTLQPKIVRPMPRLGASMNVIGNLPAVTKSEEFFNNTTYKRLLDECKQRFGGDYAITDIYKALLKVREHNKNSLSGIAKEMIIDQVELQLSSGQRSTPAKPSIAPWAQMSSNNAHAHADWSTSAATTRGESDVRDDQCAICLELLISASSTTLPCQHSFHVSCIKEWLNKKSDCPMCRKFTLNNEDYPSLPNN